jgi:hypothetical protein
MASRILLLLLGALLLCQPVAAQQSTQAERDTISQSCRGGFVAQCSDVSPGGRAALDRLITNMANLTPACQSAVGAVAPAARGK